MSSRWLAVLLATAFSLSACRGEERAAVAAVRAYDEAVIKSYRGNDASAMQGLASQEELNRLMVLVDLKRAGHLTLMSELQRFEARQVEVGAEAARVTTEERWRYFDRPDDPRLPSGDVFVADMVLEYSLVRSGTAWKVLKAKTLSSNYLEPKGYRPGRQQHAQPPQATGVTTATPGAASGGRPSLSP